MRNYLLIALMFVLGFGVIFTSLPVQAEANGLVMMFGVKGNKTIPEEKILATISNSNIGEPIDSKAVQLDLQAVYKLGYFADVHASTEKVFGGIKLIFEVVENPIFKEVKISGLTKMKNTELLAFFTQKPGEIFNSSTFSTDLKKALNNCRDKKGLLIEPNISNNSMISASGVVNLELKELRYGKVNIVIEKSERAEKVRTKEKVIRREMIFKEGDIINTNDLRSVQLRIMQSRLFNDIDISYENSETSGALDLTFTVKEADTGNIRFGVTYSAEGKWGGNLGYSEANLMGLGQNLNLDINLEDKGNNVQFSFTEPWLDQNRTSFSLALNNSNSNMITTLNKFGLPASQLYDTHFNTTGLSLDFGRPIWGGITGNLGFNFDKNKLSYSEPNVEPIITKNIPEFWDNSTQLSLTNNMLDYQDRFFVQDGYYLQGSYTIAGKYLGGNYDYQKISLEGRLFHDFTPNLVLGTRLQGATLNGDYPDYNKFYLGGSYRLRGFSDNRFANETTREMIGNSYLLSNTELRYRIPANKDFEAVLFFDAGQAFNDQTASQIKSDYGIGLRYNIPYIGMIRLDYAWDTKTGNPNFVFGMMEIF